MTIRLDEPTRARIAAQVGARGVARFIRAAVKAHLARLEVDQL